MKKKVIALLIGVCCLSLGSIPVYADTVFFTLTIHHGGSVGEPDDALSKKV